jgi:hypothetical protein
MSEFTGEQLGIRFRSQDDRAPSLGQRYIHDFVLARLAYL